MTTQVTLKKVLHQPRPEPMNPFPFRFGTLVASAASTTSTETFTPIYQKPFGAVAYFLYGSTPSLWEYDSAGDDWLRTSNVSGISNGENNFRGISNNLSAPGGVIVLSATGGGVGRIDTSLDLKRLRSGTEIRVVGGTGLGFEGVVESAQIGANASIYIDTTTVFDATTKFQIFGGSLWMSRSTPRFLVYDRITNSWTSRSTTNFNRYDALVHLESCEAGPNGIISGLISAATSTTFTSNLNCLLNQWANFQVRIKAGTGKGQIRTVVSNTASSTSEFTIESTWEVTPDATSTFVLESNDDIFWGISSGQQQVCKYRVSTNTWSQITAPTTSQFNSSGWAYYTASIVFGKCSDPVWNQLPSVPLMNGSTTVYKQSGRYLWWFGTYSGGPHRFTLAGFDVAKEDFTPSIPVYGNHAGFQDSSRLFGGVCYNGVAYLGAVKPSSPYNTYTHMHNRIYAFDIATMELRPICRHYYDVTNIRAGVTDSGNNSNHNMWIQEFVDGNTRVPYLYSVVGHTDQIVRWMLF